MGNTFEGKESRELTKYHVIWRPSRVNSRVFLEKTLNLGVIAYARTTHHTTIRQLKLYNPPVHSPPPLLRPQQTVLPSRSLVSLSTVSHNASIEDCYSFGRRQRERLCATAG